MIHTRGLTRHFRVKDQVVEAVRGIDLDVAEGELVAFLGPNGAGKSTTLRMLTTLLTPTAGTAEVAGVDVVASPARVRERIGFIGQGNGAGHSHRVGDELVTQGRTYGLDRAAARTRAGEVLEAFGLSDMVDRKVSTLSGGQQRRLDIAMGMVHHPTLLFLDEPSTGLDPQNRANLKEHILALRRDHHATVVLTTHYLDEADALADRVIVIDHGRVIADDTPVRLKSDLVGDLVSVTAFDDVDAARVAAALEALAPGRPVQRQGVEVSARIPGGASVLPELLRHLDQQGTPAASAEVARATLDDVFLHLTGRSLRESAMGDASVDTTPSTPTLQEQAS